MILLHERILQRFYVRKWSVHKYPIIDLFDVAKCTMNIYLSGEYVIINRTSFQGFIYVQFLHV